MIQLVNTDIYYRYGYILSFRKFTRDIGLWHNNVDFVHWLRLLCPKYETSHIITGMKNVMGRFHWATKQRWRADCQLGLNLLKKVRTDQLRGCVVWGLWQNVTFNRNLNDPILVCMVSLKSQVVFKRNKSLKWLE